MDLVVAGSNPVIHPKEGAGGQGYEQLPVPWTIKAPPTRFTFIVNLYCIPIFTSACHCFGGLENSLFLVIIIPSVYPDVVKDDSPGVPAEPV